MPTLMTTSNKQMNHRTVRQLFVKFDNLSHFTTLITDQSETTYCPWPPCYNDGGSNTYQEILKIAEKEAAAAEAAKLEEEKEETVNEPPRKKDPSQDRVSPDDNETFDKVSVRVLLAHTQHFRI